MSKKSETNPTYSGALHNFLHAKVSYSWSPRTARNSLKILDNFWRIGEDTENKDKKKLLELTLVHLTLGRFPNFLKKNFLHFVSEEHTGFPETEESSIIIKKFSENWEKHKDMSKKSETIPIYSGANGLWGAFRGL